MSAGLADPTVSLPVFLGDVLDVCVAYHALRLHHIFKYLSTGHRSLCSLWTKHQYPYNGFVPVHFRVFFEEALEPWFQISLSEHILNDLHVVAYVAGWVVIVGELGRIEYQVEIVLRPVLELLLNFRHYPIALFFVF